MTEDNKDVVVFNFPNRLCIWGGKGGKDGKKGGCNSWQLREITRLLYINLGVVDIRDSNIDNQLCYCHYMMLHGSKCSGCNRGKIISADLKLCKSCINRLPDKKCDTPNCMFTVLEKGKNLCGICSEHEKNPQKTVQPKKKWPSRNLNFFSFISSPVAH